MTGNTTEAGGHTPGPWIVYDDDSSDILHITCDAREGKVPIALVEIGFDEPFESEQRANAHLLASAPSLLAELAALKASNAALVEALETAEQQLAALRAFVPAHLLTAYLLDRGEILEVLASVKS